MLRTTPGLHYAAYNRTAKQLEPWVLQLDGGIFWPHHSVSTHRARCLSTRASVSPSVPGVNSIYSKGSRGE